MALSAQELLQVQGILAFKTHSVNKANLFTGMISEEELKGLFQQSISKSLEQIAILKEFLERENQTV